MLLNLLLQVATPEGAVAAETATDGQTFSITDILSNGGWPIMGSLALMSVVAVYIFIERFLTIQKASKEDPKFMNQIRDFIYDGKIEAASHLCKHTDSTFARLIEKGIGRIGRPIADIKTAIENVGKQETARLEKNVNILATIAGIAPVFGFLGTVFGVIIIFRDIAEAGSLQIGTVAQGLYLKMVSSAAGLIVFIIAYIGYNTLVTRINKVVNRMEAHAVEFTDILEQPAR